MKAPLPDGFDDALGFLRESAERLVEEAKPRPPGDSAQAELGFSIEERDLDKVRGNYDVSRLEKRNPKLVSAITFMLGLHWMPHDVIATVCGVGWETVEAIAATRRESIREFKGRMAARLALMGEAMTPVLMEKIRLRQVTFLDLKLWHDVWAPLAGEATSIVERRESMPALDGLMRVIAEEVETHGERARMGLGSGEKLAMGAAPLLEAECIELGVDQLVDKHQVDR